MSAGTDGGTAGDPRPVPSADEPPSHSVDDGSQDPLTAAGQAFPAATATAGAERYGPLLLERHRKADGRSLLVYRRLPPAGGDSRG